MSLLKSTSIELMSMTLEWLGKTGKHRTLCSGSQAGGKLKSRESTGLSWESRGSTQRRLDTTVLPSQQSNLATHQVCQDKSCRTHTLLGPRCRSGKPWVTLQSCSPASLPNTGDHERGGDFSVQGYHHSRPKDFWLTNKERDRVGDLGDLGDHADQRR